MSARQPLTAREQLRPVLEAIFIGGVFLILLKLWTAFIPWSLSWNTTASIPEGLYVTERISALPAVGDLVCFRYEAPAWAAPRQYFHNGFRLCKHLAGVAGDRVVQRKGVFYVRNANGHTQLVGATQRADSSGRPIPQHALKLGPIPPGKVVVAAPAHTNSLDSRYLGYVPSDRIRWRIYPVWTFGS